MTINMVNSINTTNAPEKTSLLQKISLILFGLFLTIVILEIGLRIGGFTILSLQEHRNLQSIKQKGAFRIMCLGESTTQNQYPSYLEEILNQRNIGIKFSVIDKGLVGTRTSAILLNLEVNLDKYRPDMVVAMMGINDEERHILYGAVSASKIIATLCSFKVYKLTKLLWLHMATKEAPKKSIELDPDSGSAYRELGKLYRVHGKFAEAEQSFKKAIEFNPKDDLAYKNLGWLYTAEGRFVEAEEVLKETLELNPKNDSAYRNLGWLYKAQEKFTKSEDAFKKAIELNPKDDSAYRDLGWLYTPQGKLVEAEQMLKKAIELNPENDSAFKDLGWLYRIQGKLVEAEDVLKKAIELNPDKERLYGSLAMIYRDMGDDKLFKMYAEKASNLRDNYYNAVTVNNYRQLKQILDKRKIRLVCVQYPMRNIKLLKRIFEEETEGSVIFVDNEKIFKDAIIKEGYKEYFRDMFGGDFGHCTEKGNRLLAENIANAILKEMYGK